MNSMEHIPDQINLQRRTEIGNNIQMDIARIQAHDEEEQTHIIIKNAKTIGEYLDSHPEILDEYEKNRDSALEKIESILH